MSFIPSVCLALMRRGGGEETVRNMTLIVGRLRRRTNIVDNDNRKEKRFDSKILSAGPITFEASGGFVRG